MGVSGNAGPPVKRLFPTERLSHLCLVRSLLNVQGDSLPRHDDCLNSIELAFARLGRLVRLFGHMLIDDGDLFRALLFPQTQLILKQVPGRYELQLVANGNVATGCGQRML